MDHNYAVHRVASGDATANANRYWPAEGGSYQTMPMSVPMPMAMPSSMSVPIPVALSMMPGSVSVSVPAPAPPPVNQAVPVVMYDPMQGHTQSIAPVPGAPAAPLPVPVPGPTASHDGVFTAAPSSMGYHPPAAYYNSDANAPTSVPLTSFAASLSGFPVLPSLRSLTASITRAPPVLADTTFRRKAVSAGAGAAGSGTASGSGHADPLPLPKRSSVVSAIANAIEATASQWPGEVGRVMGSTAAPAPGPGPAATSRVSTSSTAPDGIFAPESAPAHALAATEPAVNGSLADLPPQRRYRGVFRSKDKWRAQIQVGGKQFYLGTSCRGITW